MRWVWWPIALLGIGLFPAALAICQETPSASSEKQQEVGAAGDSPPAPAPSPMETLSRGPEPAPLDTYLLRDSKGGLVPVLGMSFEEFEQLWRMRRGLSPPAPPPFVLESLTLSLTHRDEAVDGTLELALGRRTEGWLRVPLRMPSAVIRELPADWTSEERFLTFDPSLEGYVLWWKGASGQTLRLKLAVAFPLEVHGEQQRLVLALPRATESALRVTVESPQVEASLTGGEGILTRHALPPARSELVVLGAAGDLQLVWRAARETARLDAPLLDVSGELVVRVESQRRVTTDARLRVRSYAAPVEAFRVRLPPGMELVPTPTPAAYTLRPVSESPSRPGASAEAAAALPGPGNTAGKAAPQDRPSDRPPPAVAPASAPPMADLGQLIEVRFERPSLAPPDVQLTAELPGDRPPPARLLPARFEVLSAARQRGTIDFAVDGQWQLEWTEDASVHRLDLTPEAAASRLVARFEYFRQPCELALHVAPRPSRVSVEPTHLIYVDPQQVRVETTLKYRFRGARAQGLTFELGEWELERLSPDASLDLPTREGPIRGRLEVPFLPGAAPAAELELKLEAHRRLPETAERLVLTLPRPVADLVAPATIWIFAADNLELTPLGDELVGLMAEQPGPRPTTAQTAPLVYRDLGGGEPALFVATLRRRQRLTTVSGHATVRLERQQLQIEQRLEYRVAHDPQRHCWLTVPREAAAAGALQVWFDGQPLPVETQTALPDPVDSGLMRLGFSLPAAQLGMFQVQVRQSLPLDWDRQGPYPLTLPLAVPPDELPTRFLGQRVDFLLGEGVRIEPELETVDELARPIPVPSAGAAATFTWEKPVCLSHWMLRLTPGAEGALVTVPRMWVQTWLGAQVRRDRVCLHLQTTREQVRLRLPAGIQTTSVQVAVDAQEVRGELREPRMLIVPLPPAPAQRDFVVEVAYTLPPPETAWGWRPTDLRCPQVEDASPPRRVYWQLVLPEDCFLLLPPSDLVAEMTPAMATWPWLRQPVMDQPQLEAWIQATRQPPLPRSSRRYLFGTLGRWPTLETVIVHRRLLVVTASSTLLVLGLLLIHIPWLRRPGLLWVLAVGLLAGSLIAPDTALLIAQAGAWGLITLLVAAALAWLTAPPRPVLRPMGGVSGPIRGETGSKPPSSPATRPDRSSQRTATAAAAPVEVPP